MIRAITANDKELYINLVTEFYSTDAVLHPIPIENIQNTFFELMRSDIYAEAYIIENDSNPCGYALLAKEFSQEAGGLVIWLEELYITPENRSKNFGTELIQFVFNKFPQAKRFRLEVEEYNTGAIKLYNRMGFEKLNYDQYIVEK